jgi:hypothetical protein
MESVRRALRSEVSEPRLSPSKQAELAEKRVTLQRRIARWILIQAQYMPCIVAWRQRMDDLSPEDGSSNSTRVDDSHPDPNSANRGPVAPPSDVNAVTVPTESEKFPLLLPSGLHPTLMAACSTALLNKERRLRHAQLESILRDLRRLLRINAGVFNKKKQNVTGQKAGTRANTLMTQFERKIALTVARYQDVRKRLVKLDPGDAWQQRLQPMKTSDARAAHQDVQEATARKSSQHQSAGRRTLSWIWTVPRAEANQEESVTAGPTPASAQEVSEGACVCLKFHYIFS